MKAFTFILRKGPCHLTSTPFLCPCLLRRFAGVSGSHLIIKHVFEIWVNLSEGISERCGENVSNNGEVKNAERCIRHFPSRKSF